MCDTSHFSKRVKGLILNSIHTRGLPEDENNFTALSSKDYIVVDRMEAKEWL